MVKKAGAAVILSKTGINLTTADETTTEHEAKVANGKYVEKMAKAGKTDDFILGLKMA